MNTTTTTTSNPYAPPRAVVRDIVDATAPNVLADPGTRLGAAILDTIVFAVMCYTPLILVMVGAAASGPETGQGLLMVGLVLMTIGVVAWLWLTIKYVAANGQTIAKKWLGIKVVRTDGSKASVSRIFWLRNVVNAVISVIPLYGLIDVLFIFSEKRQCLHDRLADTIVVKA